MNTRNENGLFGALESELRKAKEPLDAVAMFDMPSVRQHVETVSRVSDYLGNLWRKGLVLRLPAPAMPGSKTRWLYVWKNKGPAKKPVVDMSKAIAYDQTVESLFSRPGIEVTDEGGVVTITLPNCTISIKQNR